MRLGLGQGKRIAVIGGSAAGAAAAARIKRLYPNAQVYLFEKGKYVSYGSCELPYFLSGEISSASKLQLYTPEQLSSEKNITVATQTQVNNIDRSKQELLVEHDGKESPFSYDKLVIATGSTARTILTSFGQFSNVFRLKSIDDAQKIKKFIKAHAPAKLTILGAGYIALEIIDALRLSGLSINILDIDDLPLPGYALNARQTLKKMLEKSQINYTRYEKINDYADSENQLKSILCGSKWHEADFFIEAMGVLPSSSLAIESGLEIQTDQSIKVDRFMKTSSANIFAAGDVAHGFHAITEKPYYYPLAQTANIQARVASLNLFSAKKKISGFLGTSGLSFFDWEWVKTGFTYEEACHLFPNIEVVEFSTSNMPEIMPDSSPVHWNVVYQKNTKKIFGATIWGKENIAGKINTLALAIRNSITVEELSSGDYLYSPRFSPMIDGFQILGRLVK